MKKKLDLLENLQTIDRTIDERKAEQARLREVIATFEDELSAVQEILSGHNARMIEINREKSELEASLHTGLESIRRSESNMKDIRTNKEYQAVGREITNARKQVSETEEQLLLVVTRMDDLQAEINGVQEKFDACETSLKNCSRENLAAIDNLQNEINEITVKRNEIVGCLAGSLVKRYNQLREQRRGQALAEARDGSCLGCNMKIPPQMFNMMFKGEEMFFCPHCQRILILKQEPPVSSAEPE